MIANSSKNAGSELLLFIVPEVAFILALKNIKLGHVIKIVLFFKPAIPILK